MSVPRHHFEQLYGDRSDPWDLEDRWTELRKRDLVMASLPHARFRRAVEPGCANGALTAHLALRTDELHAFDLVEAPVHQARRRMQGFPHVTVLQADFPDYWPPGTGDLVVWSEVAYYLDRATLDLAVDGLERWLEPGGTVLAVHYIGPTDNPLTGHDVTDRLDNSPLLSRLTSIDDARFVMGVWRRRDLLSCGEHVRSVG